MRTSISAMRLLLAFTVLVLSTVTATAEPDDCTDAPPFTPALGLKPLQTLVSTSCLPRANDWMIVAHINDDRDGMTRVTSMLVDRKGRKLAARQDVHSEGDGYVSLELERTLDLDGDGEMEVLGTELRDRGNQHITRLVILGLRNGDIARLFEIPIEVRIEDPNGGRLTCASPYTLAPDGAGRRIEIGQGVIARDKNAPPITALDKDLCASARRSFVWSRVAGMRELGKPEAFVKYDPACPSLERIATLMKLRARQTLAETRCSIGKFPRQATVIVAKRAQDDETGMVEQDTTTMFILEGQRVIARYRPREYADITGVFDEHRLVQTGDLDGDGIDELMIEKRSGSPMGFGSKLLVFRVRGGTLVKLSEYPYQSELVPGFQPQSEHEEPRFTPEDTLACDASVALVPKKTRGAELVVTRKIRAGINVPKAALVGFCGRSQSAAATTPGTNP